MAKKRVTREMVKKAVASKGSRTRAKDIARLKKIREKIGAQLGEARDILRAYPPGRRDSVGWMIRIYACLGHLGKVGGVDLEVFSPKVTMKDTIETLEAESEA